VLILRNSKQRSQRQQQVQAEDVCIANHVQRAVLGDQVNWYTGKAARSPKPQPVVRSGHAVTACT
jgi:hypothetical protein